MAASSYFKKLNSNTNSFYAIAITVIAHVAAVLFFVHFESLKDVFQYPVSPMQMVRLKTKISEPVSARLPSISFQPRAINLNFPVINIDPVDHVDLTVIHSSSDIPYELPNKNSQLYRDIFDPNLRRRLQEAHANRRFTKRAVLDTWGTPDGITIVDVGNGECMMSLPKVDAHERGDSWSMIRMRCGKTDSEKIMDNVMADVEARKHPLKIQ